VTDRLSVRPDTYYDSVTLMLASRDAEGVEGVTFAAAVTATPVNLSLLEAQGFDLADENPGPNDLIVALRASGDDAADAAEQTIADRLTGSADIATRASGDIRPRSFRSATRRNPDINLAFVAVPGRFATVEVAQALESGLDVFCFSDGLSLEDEAAFKKVAIDRGLLLMGADCGTAIIDGVALGFANGVERGPIGIVGASGTGIQEVTCLLASAGIGISHAIGVGGRDLSSVVGGAMTMRGIELLDADHSTSIIVVISKPPDGTVAGRVIEAAGRATKPVVVGFLGGGGKHDDAPANVDLVGSLEAAAYEAARLAGAEIDMAALLPQHSTPGFVRGLFCGGSLCYEAMIVLAVTGREVASNVPIREEWRIADIATSEGHTFIDFGEDELTAARAHPMIDPTLRNERLERESRDPQVGAIVLDVILGFGAHPDPAGDLAPIISGALARRPDELTIAVALCGAVGDPQGVDDQARRLAEAGAFVTRNSAQAARSAIAAVARPSESTNG
jgi:FdrA protein